MCQGLTALCRLAGGNQLLWDVRPNQPAIPLLQLPRPQQHRPRRKCAPSWLCLLSCTPPMHLAVPSCMHSAACMLAPFPLQAQPPATLHPSGLGFVPMSLAFCKRMGSNPSRVARRPPWLCLRWGMTFATCAQVREQCARARTPHASWSGARACPRKRLSRMPAKLMPPL